MNLSQTALVILVWTMPACFPPTDVDEEESPAAQAQTPAETRASNAVEYAPSLDFRVMASSLQPRRNSLAPGLKVRVENRGDRTIVHLGIRADWLDTEGQSIGESRATLVWRETDSVDLGFLNRTPFRPGHTIDSPREGYFYNDDLPADVWAARGGSVRIEPVEIEFE